MSDATDPAPAPGTPPRADCVADSAGGITFDIAVVDAAEPVLVLRRRGGSAGPAPSGGPGPGPVPGGAPDEARLPLTPAGAGHLRAVLPGTVQLAEGRWDAYLGDRAVEPGVRDLRALVDRVPDERDGVRARVPYPTADGRLAVRSWVRRPHAEAGDIVLGEGVCTVEGTLYGARCAAGAVAEARLGGTVHRVPAGGEGGAFAFTVPYDLLAEPPVTSEQLWELWLRPDAGAEPVRVARVLDDVWDRKNVFVYPAHRGEGYGAAPCYTADNDLCVRLTP
ncbi:hypothetical protein [Streptomyces lavendofoliae]|uniref:Transferase n=1 Tax=Streptomyces lavendofoliae TaxID=67314 RepID=A0A918I163_9ACTN|nr:hypothetical protein [Streptomyces lavendofoliae]GGU55978.1 hypothetical protein GCM10010274_51310 [Streptomyces lavendofoliae]